MHEAEVTLGKSRFSRYSQTSLTILLLILSFIAVGKLNSPAMNTQNLIGSWSSPGVIDLQTVSNTSDCKSPDFLLFSYDFKGLAMGCACSNSIIHSGYCTKSQIQRDCRDTSPIYPRTLTSFNSSSFICARVSSLVMCSEVNRSCTTNLCSSRPSDPCPLLDIQVAVFLPGNNYFKIMDLDFNGESLYASRMTGRSPIHKTTTIKGRQVCSDSSIQNIGDFVNTVYKQVTILQEKCTVGYDTRWRTLSSMQDYIMYESNNITLTPEGNFFNIFVKNIVAVTKDSLNSTSELSKLGVRFESVCILLSVGNIVLFAVQQAILHRFHSASPLIFVIYVAYMFIAAYSYTKLQDYTILCQKVTLLDDESKKDMAQFRANIEVCSKLLLAVSVMAAVATALKTIKLAVEFRKVCKRIKRVEDNDHK